MGERKSPGHESSPPRPDFHEFSLVLFPRRSLSLSLSSPRLLITGSNFYEGEIWRPVYDKPVTEGQGRYRERGYGATMVKSLEGCISLAGRASAEWLEMIAARPKQYCKNMSYIINAKARSLLARPLSNSQYIFIGLIDFSRAVAVILSKVAAAQLRVADPINFYFSFRCMRDSSWNECRPSEMVVEEDRTNVISRVR